MTDHDDTPQSAPGGPPPAQQQRRQQAVGYEEWLEEALGLLGDDDYVIVDEAEELLLSRLGPITEGPDAGVPSDVANLADAHDTPSRRAEVLVHDLHAAAWRMPRSWPAGQEASRPLIYPRSDGSLYAEAVGVRGVGRSPENPGGRAAAFEHHMDLRSLSCSTSEDLRALHATLVRAVGAPFGDPA